MRRCPTPTHMITLNYVIFLNYVSVSVRVRIRASLVVSLSMRFCVYEFTRISLTWIQLRRKPFWFWA